MHTLTELKVLRDEFEKAVEGYRTSVLMNKEHSLEDRWTAYLEIEKFLPIDTYSDGFIEVLGWESVYDEFYMERYQTRNFSDLLIQIEEKLQEAEAYPEEYSEHILEAKPLLDNWKETVLASGYGGFSYDW